MIRPLHIFGLVLPLLLAAPLQAHQDFGTLRITVEPEPKSGASHGYMEYWFVVQNRSTDRGHDVRLTMPRLHDSHGGEELREVSRGFQVGPSATVRVALLVPMYPGIAGSHAGVTIDGREQEEALSVNIVPSPVAGLGRHAKYSPYGISGSCVLVSPRVPKEILDAFERARSDPRMHSGPGLPRMKPPVEPGNPGPLCNRGSLRA